MIFKKIIYVILGIIALIYLVNPTAGFIEVIPDNIPFIGNLDEFAASALLIKAIRVVFGKDDIESKNNDLLDTMFFKRD